MLSIKEDAVKIRALLKADKNLSTSINDAEIRAIGNGRLMSPADLVLCLCSVGPIPQRLDKTQKSKLDLALTQLLITSKWLKSFKGDYRGYGFDLTELLKKAGEVSRDFGGKQSGSMSVITSLLTISSFRDPAIIEVQEVLRASGLTPSKLAPKDQIDLSTICFKFERLGFGTDLSRMANIGVWEKSPLVGMESELEILATILTSGRDSVVLVGEPGVGKTALVEGFAYHLAQGSRPLIPPSLDHLVLVSISMVDLISGTSGRGDLEARLESMLEFFYKNPNVVPFFDEIHTLLDTEDQTARSIATALKPAMASGRFRCIGASTDQEYAKFIANDQAMNSRFSKLLLQEPDRDTAREILSQVKETLVPKQHKRLALEITPEAIDSVVNITSEYQRNDCLPRKGVQLLRKSISNKIYELEIGRTDNAIITPQNVASTFSNLSGIPVDELLEDRDEFYQQLSGTLRERLVGQDQAIDATVKWLRLQAKGWIDSRRPRGVFLFLGPPGTGKTELALNIADLVMRDAGSLVEKQMGEYQGEGARSKFMGSDPGYIGFGQVNTVYSHIMMRPYSVVVMDEFEKADYRLADVLLSIFSGSGEDSQGRRVDFSQCIFILTSNALDQLHPLKDDNAVRLALGELGGIFTRPLVDRLNSITRFNPLGKEAFSQILDNMIAQRQSRAQKPLPVELKQQRIRDGIVTAASGDGQMSARALERAFNSWLEEKI